MNHLSTTHKKHTNWFDGDIEAANHQDRKESKRARSASQVAPPDAAPKRARISSCMLCYTCHVF